jgi:hypothetical protein
MKQKMTISLMSALTMLSLVSFSATAWAQQPKSKLKPIGDTGLITLGFNQILRVTGDWDGDGAANIQFRQLKFTADDDPDHVRKYIVASDEYFSRVTLRPGEAASVDILSNSFGVRAMVFSDNPNVRVNAVILDMTTGHIIAVLMPL